MNAAKSEMYMPEHPRRKGQYHANNLELYHTPCAECLLTELIYLEEVVKLPEEGDDQLPEPDVQLSPEEKRQLLNILERHRSTLTKKPRRTSAAHIKIETGDVYPIHLPAYRVPFCKVAAD